MYNKLLIAIDLADLKSAKYVVDTALQMTAKIRMRFIGLCLLLSRWITA